jgi:hypothetical protein
MCRQKEVTIRKKEKENGQREKYPNEVCGKWASL